MDAGPSHSRYVLHTYLLSEVFFASSSNVIGRLLR